MKDSDYYVCARCKRDKKTPSKFSKENKIIPSKIPDALKTLTQVEEMLISRAFPVMQIHTKPNGCQKVYKGHVNTLLNDVQKLTNILPRHPKDIPLMVLKFSGKDNKPQELKVRRKNVEDALIWLTGTNIFYKDITIDYDLQESLPVNGYLPETKSVEFDGDELDLIVMIVMSMNYLTCNNFHNILKLFDVLPNFPSNLSETMGDYSL